MDIKLKSDENIKKELEKIIKKMEDEDYKKKDIEQIVNDLNNLMMLYHNIKNKE